MRVVIVVMALAMVACGSSEHSSAGNGDSTTANAQGSAPDGGNGGDGDTTSTTNPAPTCTVPPVPNLTSDGSMQGDAEKGGLGTLDNIIGRFLRGDVPTYRGTVQANDNASVLSSPSLPPVVDGTIPEGPALAMLTVGPSSSGDWYPAKPEAMGKTEAALVVHGTAAKAHVVFVQTDASPMTTWAGSVGVAAANAYLHGSCDACAPNFLAATPPSIQFGLTTTGTFTNPAGSNVPVTLHTTATVNLTRVGPCDLSWADLQVLNTTQGPNEFAGDVGLGDFKLTGAEYIAHTQGQFGGASAHMCTMVTPYTLDLFVDAADVGKYGVRHFATGAPSMICAP
jgi:hypothetical protein